MKTQNSKKTQIFLTLTAVALIFSTGCGEGMKYKPIYNSAIIGAAIGGIVGYQSDETGEGVAIGASLFALGEILHQIDDNPKPRRQTQQQNQTQTQTQPAKVSQKPPVRESIKETYIIQIHNDNGSITPIEIRKEGNGYVGPAGERYESLPTEEQLKPFYGL